MKRLITILITSCFLLLLPAWPAYSGTSFTELSKAVFIKKMDNQERINQIIEQILEAKRTTQAALSKEELEKLRAKAEQVLKGQAELIVDSGAMVYVGCQIIKD